MGKLFSPSLCDVTGNILLFVAASTVPAQASSSAVVASAMPPRHDTTTNFLEVGAQSRN